MSKVDCAACHHTIDEAARICPYCGSDPKTGEKILDAEALLQQEFKPRRLTRSESVLEYARQRQGIVITVSAVVAFVILAAAHQYVTMRNQNAVTSTPAVLLTEVTDVSTPPDEGKPQPLPDLNFQYGGNAHAMRSYIVEAGAVPPPEVVAAQQAAQAAAAGQQPGAKPAQPPRPGAAQPQQRPGVVPSQRPAVAPPPQPQPQPTVPPRQ